MWQSWHELTAESVPPKRPPMSMGPSAKSDISHSEYVRSIGNCWYLSSGPGVSSAFIA